MFNSLVLNILRILSSNQYTC